MNEIFDWFIELADQIELTLKAIQDLSQLVYYYVLGSGVAIGIIFVLVIAIIANQHKTDRKIDLIIEAIEEE